jgi:murein DD-endopeptidase MepM/ murein hydrolase activator NlpD
VTTVVATAVAGVVAASPAPAASGGTGSPRPAATPAPRPILTGVRCATAPAGACVDSGRVERGGSVQLSGRNLAGVTHAIFYGSRGRRDDTWAAVVPRSARRAGAPVPTTAASGPIALVDAAGKRSRRWLGLIVESADFGLGAFRPGGPVSIQVGVSDPHTVFYGGMQKAVVNYRVNGAGAVDLRVDLVRLSDNAVVSSWTRPQARPGAIGRLGWSGALGGKSPADGRYGFRVATTGAAASGAPAAPRPQESVTVLNHIFPIRGAHNFGGSGARFGSGRTGHSHQGHDVFARCGTPLVAARAGKVVYAGYHAAAGYYAVIDGKGTGLDYAYMHLREPSLARTGQSVKTGQQLGEVGESGNARGCHLHFETWSAPGWYKGGRPIDPLPSLRRWDRTS